MTPISCNILVSNQLNLHNFKFIFHEYEFSTLALQAQTITTKERVSCIDGKALQLQQLYT